MYMILMELYFVGIVRFAFSFWNCRKLDCYCEVCAKALCLMEKICYDRASKADCF